MKLKIEKKYFKYNFDQPTSYAFHAIALNYFVKKVLTKRKDKMSTQLFFRLFRTGILGDILHEAGQKQVLSKKHTVNHELLATLFEGYLALARSIYDYLLIFLKEQYGVKEKSYHDFLKKVKKGNYNDIDEKFREHLNNTIFTDLRDLRDSAIHKTANISVYVKNKKFYINGTLYKNDGARKIIDESLHLLIFGYTSSLLLLMAYIAKKATGKSLKEQTTDIDE